MMNAHSPPRAFPSHIPALDGLRGLAVVAVIAFHLALYVRPTDGSVSLLLSVVRFGWVGVDLFLVLSGFLITGILYDNRNRRGRMRAFYGRRFLRIAPAFLIALSGAALVAAWIGTHDEIHALAEAMPWHAMYLTNFRVAAADAWSAAPLNTSHLWSLALEEQFYLLWPAFVACATRLSANPRVTLMRLCGLLVLVCIVFRLEHLSSQPIGAYTLLPARMDALAIGSFLALWARGPSGVRPLVDISLPVIATSGLAVIALAAPAAGVVSYLHPLQQGVGYTLWAVFFGAVLIRAASGAGRLLCSVLRARPLAAIGRLSYGLYLFHFPVIFVASRIGLGAFGGGAFVVGVVSVSLGVAALSWYILERPLLRLKRHFVYGEEATSELSTHPATAPAR